MRPWVKAGLIAGIICVLISIPSYTGYFLRPNIGLNIGYLLSVCLCVPIFLIYPIAGFLAVYWQTPPWTKQLGAKEGMLAGLLTAGIYGIGTSIISIVIAMIGFPERMVQQLSPEALRLAEQTGLINMFSINGQIVQSVCFVFINLALGAVLGGLTGFLFSASRKEKTEAG